MLSQIAMIEIPPTKGAFAYTELRRQILDGELVPGERLYLRALADRLGVSVQPVRDALRLLERDGLVASASHRGATVTPISRDSILDLIGVRMWLEILAVREAAPRHTTATLERVQDALADADAWAERDDPLGFSRANRAFHEAVEAPASAPLRELIESTWERVWEARRRTSLFAIAPGSAAQAQREHRRLARAVASGDGEAALTAMERHRGSTLAAWRVALARAGSGGPGGGA
jgi:DNA-binding GntR family transcriptional regulator